MRQSSRKDRKAFQPAMLGAALEERIVMNGSPVWASILRGPNGPRPGPMPGPGSGPSSPEGVTARQLVSAYGEQFGATKTALQGYLNDQITVLYHSDNLSANGRPTQEALNAFSRNVAGALNAATLGLSSQIALLPRSDQRLVPALQDSLQGVGPRSLASRIASQVDSGQSLVNQRMFQNMINRQIDSAFMINTQQVSTFLRSPQLNRTAIDPMTGQRISLSQYIGNQAAHQINNTFGNLANSVGTNASASLFDASGAFNSQGIDVFQQQYSNALNTAAYQVNGILSILPNSSSVRSQLQSNIFGDVIGGSTNLNLYNALSGAFPINTAPPNSPFTMDVFNSSFRSGFTSAYQNFNAPILDYLNGTSTDWQMPTGFFQPGVSFPGVFGPQFTGSGFNNGFNNGFSTIGNGFPGFGSVPTGFDSSFGTGFNNFISDVTGFTGFTGPGFDDVGTIGGGVITDIGSGIDGGLTGPTPGFGI